MSDEIKRVLREVEDDIREDEMVALEVDGPPVKGIYLGHRTQTANGRPTQIFMFEQPDGRIIGVWEKGQLARKVNKCRRGKYTEVYRVADIPSKLIGYSDEHNFRVMQ